MEPTTTQGGLASPRPAEAGTSPGKNGRKGSLANPELVEDVPGHVIPLLEREFDDFDNEA